MTQRVTTRLTEPVLTLIKAKASDAKKSVSESISELVSAAILSSENDKLDSFAKRITESLSGMQKEFQVHKEISQRQLQMILHILVLENEIAKHILPRDDYEKAWEKYQQKHDAYKTTGRISL